MSKRKSGNFPHSYSERNLRSARNNLKTYISNIEPENTYGDLLKILAESPNHQNVWEGETGMMEHIQPLFPMPQRMSVLIDQQKTLNMCRPTTYSIGQNLTKAANLLEKRNYDVNDQSPLGQTSSMTFDQRNNFIDGDQILPSGNLRLVPDNSDDPSLQSTSIASNCISSIVTDIEISDEAETEDSDACHDIVIKRTKTLNSTKKGKARKKRINFSNPSGSNLNLGRQFVVDMVRKDKTKASDLYVAKIEEWAGIVSDIQNISDELKKLLTPEFQICEQYPETVYKTWRQVCFLIECLHADMEMERMALKPENQRILFHFPSDLRKYISKSTAMRISKKFLQIKSAMRSQVKDLKKLHNANINLFRAYNKAKGDNQFHIKMPVLLLLNQQHRYLELQQGKPLISPMTPGLTAGVYAKEGSVHERFSRWLTQISELAEEAVPVAAFSDSGKSSFVLSKPEHCHINVSHSGAGSEAVHSLSCAQICKSHVITKLVCPNNAKAVTENSLPHIAIQKQNDKGCQSVKNQLVAHQANEVHADAAALFSMKFTEWEAIERDIAIRFQDTRKKLFSCKNESKEFAFEDLKTLSELCYRIEKFHYEMELERITLRPETTKKEWLFSDLITSKLGARASLSFNKRYSKIKRGFNQSVRSYSKFIKQYFNDGINQYNERTNTDELKIRKPQTLCLSAQNGLSKILKVQTFRDLVNSVSAGEEAVVLNKFAFVPTSHSLDLSLCSITKYDETSLKNCGRDGPSFCTEFQNIYHDWRSQALELEHSLKEADVVLNLRGAESILTTRTEVACQALFNACVSLQSLNTKYVCAKLSQRPHNRSATWRFSKPLCEIIGFDARKKLSFQFNCLYRLLKRVGKTCCGIGEESKSLIQLYNKQVEEAQIVQLPMSLSEISDEVRDLLCKGCIPETPLEKMSYLSEKTLDCNVLHHKAASSNIPLSNDCPNDEGILPSVASANNQVSKNFGINLSSDFVTTCNQQTQNKNLPNHEIFAHSVINEKQSDQLSVAFQDLPRPDTIENVGHCECGCHGTPLLNSVEMTMEVHGGAPGNELSWLQHDIKQLQNSLSEAEAQLNSRETPQHKTYKLIVDISATLPYLRTRLNRERGQTFKHGCSDLSNSVGKESREVNCAQNVGDTTDFLTVHESLASLYEDLHRIFLEEREVILDIFPHAEDFKNKRGELIQFFAPLKINKYKLSKNHIRKMKRAARIAAEKASRPPDVIVKEQELESYQRLCSALNLLKKVRGYLSHVTICVFKSGGVAKFEALKDSQKRMTNLFRNLELCSRKLSPESSLHLRDFQMGEIPKHLHAAFKTFPGDGAGVNAQAQVVLQRCYTSFQIIMKKFSPEFVENLGIQFSLE